MRCSTSPLAPTVPYPPLNVSYKIIHLNQRAAAEVPNMEAGRRSSRQTRDIPLMMEEEQQMQETQSVGKNVSIELVTTHTPFNTTYDTTEGTTDDGRHTEEAEPQSYWLDPTERTPVDRDEEFVNAVVSEYEDSNDLGSAMNVAFEAPVLPTRLPPILLELRWLPPRPPISYDGFNVYIYRDGKIHSLSWATAGSAYSFSSQPIEIQI